VTVWLQVAECPDVSVAVQVIVVVPFGNTLPAGTPLELTMTPGQLSLAVAEPRFAPVTTAVHVPASVLTVLFAGQVIVGFSLSFTVTVNEQLLVLPEASVTVKVLVVAPFGKSEPESRPAVCMVVWPGQLSVPTGAV